MARFLSPEWFADVASAYDPPPDVGADPLVVRQVVTGTPYGQVTYRVLAGEGAARIEPPGRAGTGPARDELTVTTDWNTARAIAAGELSTQAALVHGRLRVGGATGRLAERAGRLAPIDALPARVRDSTTF